MAKKYIDAEKLKGLLDTKYKEFIEKAKKDYPLQYQYMADGLEIAGQFVDSLQQQTDGILNSYIEQRCKELDAIIQEEMTPDNTVTVADKIGAMTAKNELLRIKELI